MFFGLVRLKFLLLGFFVGVIGFVFWLWFTLPSVSILKDHLPVLRYQSSTLSPRVSFVTGMPRGWVKLREVSKGAMGAVIVSEDALFFSHCGFDLEQIKNALEDSIEAGRFVRGASTITQQVVRNVFLEKDRTLWRKLKELLLAIRLEKTIGKRKILEIYFNIAEWGEGIYGIREAAEHYFGKHPLQLSAKEGAFLAMLLPSPKRYSASFRERHLTTYARYTVNSILKKMALVHYLSEEEFSQERNSPLSFEKI